MSSPSCTGSSASDLYSPQLKERQNKDAGGDTENDRVCGVEHTKASKQVNTQECAFSCVCCAKTNTDFEAATREPNLTSSGYLRELYADKWVLQSMRQTLEAPFLTNSVKLLDKEIRRVENVLGRELVASVLIEGTANATEPVQPPTSPHTCAKSMKSTRVIVGECFSGPSNAFHLQSPDFDASGGELVTVHEKVLLPDDDEPGCDFNFIGRLMGPRGMTIKRLEQETGCRLLVRGRGSVKSEARAQALRRRPGFEHLDEPLHILVSAQHAQRPLALRALRRGVRAVRRILKPVDNDELKQKQMRELAIINGTYRPVQTSPYQMAQMQMPHVNFFPAPMVYGMEMSFLSNTI